jgi:cytochrome c
MRPEPNPATRLASPILLAAAAAVLFTGAASPLRAAEQGGAAPSTGYDPLARPSARTVIPGAAPVATDESAEELAVPLNPEFDNLPDAPGAEQTFYLCSACHSLAIVKQQRLTDARWDYLWTWMVEEQGMPEQTPEDKEAILGYLKRHFSAER